jgi:hypothetical protein
MPLITLSVVMWKLFESGMVYEYPRRGQHLNKCSYHWTANRLNCVVCDIPQGGTRGAYPSINKSCFQV